MFATAVTAWAGATLVASSNSPFRSDASAALQATLAAAGVWLVVVVRPAPRWVVGAVGTTAVAVAAGGFLAWAAGSESGTFPTGPFLNSNSLGAAAAIAVVLCVTLAGSHRPSPGAGRPARAAVPAVAVGVAAVCAQALLRTGSMGGLLAACTGLVAVACGTWRRGGTTGLRRFVLLTAATAAAALALGVAGSVLSGDDTGTAAAAGIGVDPDNHAAEHFAEWYAAYRVWIRFPLLGTGPRTFPAASRAEAAADPTSGVGTAGYEDARSDLFTLLAETGLVGAAAWATAFVAATWAAVRGLLHDDSPDSPVAPLAARGSLVVVVAYGLVDVTAAVPLLMACGLALGAVCVTTGVKPGRERDQPEAQAVSARR